MKTLNLRTPLIVLMLIISAALVAKAQDSRIQMGSLDHLAAKASQTVDVNIDERLIRIAAKVFSDKDADEREMKKLVIGLKGIYVKSFEFDNEGQYVAADVESIRAQLRGPGWTRLVGVNSKKEGNLEVYLLLNGETVGGLAVLHTDEKELTVVNIVGPVDLEKLAQLEGQLGVPDLGIEPQKPKTKN
jgi:polynucleotide 5'-kinase involved in rRNA processing